MNKVRRKGRRGEGGGGGGRAVYSAFSLPELLSSLLRIPFSYLIPHPEILANPVSRQDILRLLDVFFWYKTGHFRVTPSLCFKTGLSVKMIFYFHAKKTYSHEKGLVLSLVLKQRLGVTLTTYLMYAVVWADHRAQVQRP